MPALVHNCWDNTPETEPRTRRVTGPDPSSPRRSVARPTRRSLASPDAWASPMTDLARAPATIVEGPSQPQPDSCHDACALCQQPMVEGRSSRSPSSIWRFPCRCRMRTHVACMVQMRVRNHAPACMHCRDPWPGESADAALVSACQQANVSLEDSWGSLPEEPEHDILEGMPPRPDHVLVLCYASVSGWGGAMHAREMEWSPNRMFRINEQGIRVQIGWQGAWGCNTCGRTILHEDPEINGAVAAADSSNFCPADGQRTLIVDLAHGSRNWVCLPGCTWPTCMERVCPDENIPDQRHDHALLVPAHRSALPNFFSALPPRQYHEGTNSFVYCPILLHSAGLLEQGAYVEWCGVARFSLKSFADALVLKSMMLGIWPGVCKVASDFRCSGMRFGTYSRNTATLVMLTCHKGFPHPELWGANVPGTVI